MKALTRWMSRLRLGRGRLVARRESFHRLVPREARLERLATGLHFTEGPVWMAERGLLIFSDIPADRLLMLRPGRRPETFRHPSGHSNGCTLDGRSRLIVCEHGNRRVSRTEPDGSITVLADRFRGARLNSPNDVVVGSDGAVYFTDPPYGIQPEEQEQPFQGVYRISPNGADVRLVASDVHMPNGLAFSPCGSRLFVSDSSHDRRHVRVFDVDPDGGLSKGRLFCDMRADAEGSPDGMKVDVEGNLYCVGPGGIWVLSHDGEHLGSVVTPEQPANCAWGSPDWKNLYITARTSVYQVRCSVPGVPVGMERG